MISAYKQLYATDISNYRPINILPNLSKVFENRIYNQLLVFFDKVLSKYQCGFRKGFSAQRCLIKLLEQSKKSTGQGFLFSALSTDLYQKHSTVYSMSYLLLNFVLMEWKIHS